MIFYIAVSKPEAAILLPKRKGGTPCHNAKLYHRKQCKPMILQYGVPQYVELIKAVMMQVKLSSSQIWI